MSLLLDALKEAEARKREAAPGPVAESPFETVGALALAEDSVPEPHATPPSPAAAPHRPSASPAEVLLAARAARDAPATPSATPFATRAAAAAASPPPARPQAASPAPAPATAAAPTATTPAGVLPGRPRGALPWLLGVAGLMALLVGGATLYDALVNRVPATALPPVPETVAPVTPAPPAPPPPAAPAAAPAVPPGPAAAMPPPRPRLPPDNARPPDAAAATAATSTTAPAPTPPIARISISREPAPLDAAWAAHQLGNLDLADALYRRVLDAESGQVDAQLGLAVIAHARGNDAAARRGYRRVLESVPDHPRAWAGLAELSGEDDSGGIESRLRQLLASRPAAPLHFALGNVLARQERWADAQQEYFAAATLAPEAADYAYNVAVALERIGKTSAALPWYRRALQQAADGRAARFDAAAARTRLEQLQATPP